ncbi:MAG: outer membrane protein assembly factor BamA, partial [Pseudomonadota bacterium]
MGLGKICGTSRGRRPEGVKISYALQFFTIALIAVWSLVAALPASAQTFTFNNFAVEGNQRIQTATILSYTGIEPGTSLSAGQLNDAYRRVVDSGVFETVEFVPQGRTLLIRVEEFPTINRIS